MSLPHAATRPAADEYASYYETYVGKVPDGDVLARLETQIEVTRALLSDLSPEGERFRYAEGKWSVREAVGHLLDTERVFAFRALWFARRSQGALPGMDQDEWAAASNAGDRPLDELLGEWAATRRSNVRMLRGLPPETWDRRGIASGLEFSVRALAWILAGHEIHHRGIFEERYLPGLRAK